MHQSWAKSTNFAALSFDGGRYQVFDRSEAATSARAEQRQSGKRRKGEHWKESRVACVMSMSGPVHQVDPMPELPAFLAGGSELKHKLTEIGHVMALPTSAVNDPTEEEEPDKPNSPRRSRKKTIPLEQRPLPSPDLDHRDCVSSSQCWREFGETVAAEAWLKGFAGARRKVCVCDGNDAIRRVCETHFSDYVHVLDLMHALGYAMNAARAVGGSRSEINDRYRQWAEKIWRGEVKLVIAELDGLIYELHVRGFTQHPNSGADAKRRGTFLGVCDKIPYLQSLGVTAVELMPVFQFDPDDGNYWGYMPLALFAPHHAYASDPRRCHQRDEFRTMVKQLHTVGIEVLLDVVYNHTCEGDDTGPVYSLKGIDSNTYYVASRDAQQPYANFSGTGNTLHTANRTVRRLVVDSMRYWVNEMHVDGFRFDLASIFTRGSDGEINLVDPPIVGQIGAEDDLADIRLIAEPWDASGAFQLGRGFPGMRWMQWNASFRQCVQRFVRGDRGMTGELMTRLYGSCDLFPDERFFAYRPFQSVNYVSSHDGMTMADLVSFNERKKGANGHGNTDGPMDFSRNCGWEGIEGVSKDMMNFRKRMVKNYFALLMLAAGTPMFRMGDEFMNTQFGNSNPYNQDNETSWLDWSKADTHQEVLRFVRMMIAFRQSHPSIGRSRFWREDIKWYGKDHLVNLSPNSTCLAYCLHGKSQEDNDLYVMLNNGDQSAVFGIQEGCAGDWASVVDTSLQNPEDIVDEDVGQTIRESFYEVAATSIVVLIRG